MNFFFSTFIIEAFCTKFQYPNLGWNYTLPVPLLPIYYSSLWDTKYATMFYDICEHFLGSIYFTIFKGEAPSFSKEYKTFIAKMGDWYVGESFSYIIIWGSNTIHMLPKIVPDRFVIEEVPFQTVTDGG